MGFASGCVNWSGYMWRYTYWSRCRIFLLENESFSIRRIFAGRNRPGIRNSDYSHDFYTKKEYLREGHIWGQVLQYHIPIMLGSCPAFLSTFTSFIINIYFQPYLFSAPFAISARHYFYSDVDYQLLNLKCAGILRPVEYIKSLQIIAKNYHCYYLSFPFLAAQEIE